MPVDLPARRARRHIRIARPRKFPYIMVFVLCALVVIVGTKWPTAHDPLARSSQTEVAP